MIDLVKKNLKFFYKNLLIYFFSKFYGKPKLIKKNAKDQFIQEHEIILEKKKYKVFQLFNGSIYTNSNDTTAYISKNGNLSSASMQFSKFDNINSLNSKVSKNETLASGTPRFKKKYNGNILSLLSGGASKSNFTHWFTDVIPRIKIFNEKFNLKKIDKFYVPSLKYKFQVETLEYLGIKKDKIITSENFKHICADSIFATSHPCHFHPMKVKKWSLNYIRNLYLPQKKTNKFKKIFIERDQLGLLDFDNLKRSKNLRVLLNETEIKEYLKLQGFKIIKPEEFSFLKQVQIFSNANFIIGMYGAAMMMISFCKKKTKILELKPLKGGNEFKNISNLIGLKHKQINLKPIFKSSTPQNGLINCPINIIKKELSYK
tara:strand:- start:40 stop:1161 length:1122 start_codon:yes stop_codon:yes gene_type:complete